MTRREIWLVVLVVLLVGVLGGFVAATVLSDDDGEVVTNPDPTTTPPTTAAPTSAPSTAPPTTAPPGTAPATTATPATTTPEAPPLADAVTGEVLGLPIGSELENVLAAMTARYGEPDLDSDWNTGCPLDGDESLDERTVRWGDFVVRGHRDDAMAFLDGWRYGRDAAGEFDVSGPRPEELVLHDGVAWNMTIGEVAEALDAELVILGDFGFSTVAADESTDYRGVDTSPDSFLGFVGHRSGDLCD